MFRMINRSRSSHPVPSTGSGSRSWVSGLFQSFEQHEEMYRVAQESVSTTPDHAVESPSGSVTENVNQRFEQINFMKKLLIGAPQIVGHRRAWDIYNDVLRGDSEYLAVIYGKGLVAPAFEGLDEFKQIHRQAVSIIKREEEKAKAPKRRKSAAENEGYSEPVHEPEIEHWRFEKSNVVKSLVEDKRKADFYASICASLKQGLGPDRAAIDSDNFADVLKRATEQYLRNEARPVLTNELADFSNPYMMQRSTEARLLHEACVRNKLEESLVDSLLDSEQELVKLRAQADLPPEVVEPLQAFRGVREWSFDPEIRMGQKLTGIASLLDRIVTDSLELPNSPHSPSSSTGFTSTTPRGRLGGWGHGKKKSSTECHARYPTLQRVAHRLPRDPQYRAQAVHAIQVLERSRGWTFSDKLKAVNVLKEVLDNLPSSRLIEGKLEKALPVKRAGRGPYQLVRRKPSNLRRRNRIRMYFRSPVAVVPLARRWSERRAKNAVRAKKKK